MIQAVKKQSLDRLLIHTNEGFVVIPRQNIIRLKADGNYTTFHLDSGNKHIASHNLNIYNIFFKRVLHGLLAQEIRTIKYRYQTKNLKSFKF